MNTSIQQLESEIELLNNQKVGYIKTPDGHYFVLTELTKLNRSIQDEFKEMYKNQFESIKNRANASIAQDSLADLQAQFKHLTKEMDKRRGAITVPNDLIGKPCIVWLNEVMPIRIINYTYKAISGLTRVLYAKELLTQEIIERCKVKTKLKLDNSIDNNQMILMQVSTPWQIPLIMAYSALNNKIYTPNFINFHSRDIPQNRLCTGNALPKTIWDMNDKELTEYMCTMNTYSPGSTNIQIEYGSMTMDFYKFVKANVTINKIELREENKWRVTT